MYAGVLKECEKDDFLDDERHIRMMKNGLCKLLVTCIKLLLTWLYFIIWLQLVYEETVSIEIAFVH